MPRYFEFYDGDYYHEYRITKNGYYMHRWGICSQHFMMNWSIISEQDYVSAYESYKGY